jgi:hypothetical protein
VVVEAREITLMEAAAVQVVAEAVALEPTTVEALELQGKEILALLATLLKTCLR